MVQFCSFEEIVGRFFRDRVECLAKEGGESVPVTGGVVEGGCSCRAVDAIFRNLVVGVVNVIKFLESHKVVLCIV